MVHAKFFAASSCLFGRIKVGAGAYFAHGAVVRSQSGSVKVENDSYILENSVIWGSDEFPVHIKAKTVFGHRSIVMGATVGNLCEIGNSSIIMPGAVVGDMCILGEGTLISENMKLPDYSVVVGRPGRIIRSLNDSDRAMIARMRKHDLYLAPYQETLVDNLLMGGDIVAKLYAYKGVFPRIKESALLFHSAEITGDVAIGEKTIIGAGVKIIGDSHGPIRIGDNVQILENTVLHLLPDNELQIDDNVIIGPGCMIHGCHIGSGTVIEPGAVICDNSNLGRNSIVKAGSVVRQKSRFPDQAVIEGFPAEIIDSLADPAQPSWGLCYEAAASLIKGT